MRLMIALIAGGLFGLGLHLSGMTDTNRVQGFLDLFGNWDPTLAFVMGGAIVPMAVAWRLTTGRKPLAGGMFPPGVLCDNADRHGSGTAHQSDAGQTRGIGLDLRIWIFVKSPPTTSSRPKLIRQTCPQSLRRGLPV